MAQTHNVVAKYWGKGGILKWEEFLCVMSPRPSPIVNIVYEMSFKMFYRLVSQVYISWWVYVIVRPESLSAEGQELILYMYLCTLLMKI